MWATVRCHSKPDKKTRCQPDVVILEPVAYWFDIHVESKNLQEQLESLIVNQNNLSESDGDDDYNTTQTSLNSDDCIEYDSDLSGTNSVLFYSDSDDFIDNEFVFLN